MPTLQLPGTMLRSKVAIDTQSASIPRRFPVSASLEEIPECQSKIVPPVSHVKALIELIRTFPKLTLSHRQALPSHHSMTLFGLGRPHKGGPVVSKLLGRCSMLQQLEDLGRGVEGATLSA